MWRKIKLIQTFMEVLFTYNEEDPFKNEGARVVITDLPLYVYADFYDARGKLTTQSKTHPSFYECPCYLHE